MSFLSCQQLVELVTDYLEGGLSPEMQGRFVEHIEMCEHCAAYLEQMRQVIRLSGQLQEQDLSPDMSQALLAAFRGWKDESER